MAERVTVFSTLFCIAVIWGHWAKRRRATNTNDRLGKVTMSLPIYWVGIAELPSGNRALAALFALGFIPAIVIFSVLLLSDPSWTDARFVLLTTVGLLSTLAHLRGPYMFLVGRNGLYWKTLYPWEDTYKFNFRKSGRDETLELWIRPRHPANGERVLAIPVCEVTSQSRTRFHDVLKAHVQEREEAGTVS
jgi:hypothetical protein